MFNFFRALMRSWVEYFLGGVNFGWYFLSSFSFSISPVRLSHPVLSVSFSMIRVYWSFCIKSNIPPRVVYPTLYFLSV